MREYLLLLFAIGVKMVEPGATPFIPPGPGQSPNHHHLDSYRPKPPRFFCSPDMWTTWFDVDDTTGPGDYESLAIIQEKYPESVCNDPIGVEGKVAGTGINALRSNQRIDLNEKVGLICKNVGQTCLNYEVRFCCPRAPRCDGGAWTEFINVDTPDGDGDFETLWNVRLVDESVCKNPTAADARRALDGLHWSLIGHGEISQAGFTCKNTVPFPALFGGLLQPAFRCDDYEVRFCCPRVKRPQCGPLDWTPWLNSGRPFDGCDAETLPKLWQKYPDLICEHPTAMDVRDVMSGESYVPGPNIEASLSKGFKCCDRFGKKCSDYEVRFCCPKDRAIVPECSESWTRFFDLDDPTLKGDFELFDSLQTAFHGEICKIPLAVDARAVGTESHYPISGQVASISLDEGLVCENAKQHFGKCLDYEIRFCCPEALPSVCDEEDWTEFYNIDDPTGMDLCDCENLQTTRERHPGLCPNPTAIDVRLANGAHISTVNQVVHKSLSKGFQCYNFEQRDGETCCNYKVRYCCSVSVCPECQEYDECGSPCPATCYNWNATRTTCPEVCVPGCRCSDGFVRNHRGDCVMPSQCTCPFPVTENGFGTDVSFFSPTCDAACQCNNDGIITCVPLPNGCPGPCVDLGDGTGICLPAPFPAMIPPPPPS